MKRVMVCVACAIFQTSIAFGGEVGFAEDFALAKDRAESLKTLIPGTEDFYYYHALHFLNTEQFEKIEQITRPWLQRFGQTARLTEIQTRYALLTYEKNPEKSLAYLRNHLGLRFDQQRTVIGGTPALPTALDQNRISRSTLQADSLARWQNLDNFEDLALDWLAAAKLDWLRRRNLIQRLQRPDIPNLPALIVEDLTSEQAQPFGSFGIHRQLTLAQLDQLLKLKPDLRNQMAFVQTYLTKLQPGADDDWRHDRAKTKAYFDRMLTFVRTLDPVHNALKAHVLFHRLVLDQTQGTYDKALFLEYANLPRFQPYMSKGMLEAVESQRHPADLNANYTDFTLLPIVGPDESLVRGYLKHFFVDSNSPKEFEPYINDVYLRHLFAETKIENGLGDSEVWASQLPPELFRQLKDRIDIDFSAANKTSFAADEPVKLDLFVKNVPTLIVKVFEINTLNFYKTHHREVDTDINLDGLVANTESTQTYTEPPLRKMARTFEFPKLTKPGVYVVDFIGGGKSSRALIRKGRFRPLVAASTAGQKITVVDDADKPVMGATLWLGGQEYHADEKGAILVPFSTSPGRQPIVLSKGDFACLDYLDHQAENYSLIAGIHVDRESLLTQRLAEVIVRPGIYLNGSPISVKLLDEVRLRLVATDQDGIATSSEVPNFKLFEDRESTYEFRVPPRLASLQITLFAKVKSLSLNKPIDLSAGESFALNGIVKTDKIEDLHLAKFGSEYYLELLGLTGEPEADRAVFITLKHREFRERVKASLKTDANGRVRLGALADITNLGATGPEGTAHEWSLPLDRHTYRQAINAKFGDAITVPYMGSAAAPSHDELALFEMIGGNIRSDQFDALSIKDGMVEVRGLAAGDYELWLKRLGERIRIRVIDGPVENGQVLGKLRHMQLPGLKPVQIAAITSDDHFVSVKLHDSSEFARVHIFATRYQPAFSAYDHLSRVRDAELQGVYPAHAESVYLAGRNIGDEYRYVLDRRYQKKYPGNLLERPSLLLNPWVLRSTETGEQLARSGEDFGAKGLPPASAPAPIVGGGNFGDGIRSGVAGGEFANLDFLADASAVLVNLVPDKNGIVKISRKEIGAHAMIHVVAVDPLSTTVRTTTLSEMKTRFMDLRLRNGLDPAAHFTQQKQVSVLPPGQAFVLADAVGGRFEVYDSLPKVYSLFATLSNDPNLAEFAFLLKWPTLKPEEKRAHYSKYACHELHFFLAKKDPEFFRTVVRPYLANKKDKTFMDHWLLEDDLSEFLKPWAFDRLNMVERVLLAQRLPGEAAKTARLLQDLYRLLPPHGDRTRMLFETAVKGNALAANDALGLNKLKEEKQQLLIEGLRDTPKGSLPSGIGGAPGGGPAAPGMPPAANAKAGESKQLERAAADQMKKLDEAESGKRRAGGRAERDGKDKDIAPQKDADFFEEDRKKAKLPAQLYRKLDPTLEWAENNYYHLPIGQQLAGLVPVSEFWLDYARYDGKGPFLSRNLADASRNFTEMIFALAVLDLPFTAPKNQVVFDNGKMTFTPADLMVAFHEEVRPVGGAAGKVQILVSQNFYRNGDRYRDENGERFDKFVTNEFVIHTVYGCQVVVTNPTSSRQRLSVLIQTPVGSIPVANGQPTKTVAMELEPYHTQTIDYLFYFPMPGRFTHFPVHVAKNETLAAAAAPFTFDVVAKPTKLDTESWEYVSQNGTSEQVLAFLNRENVFALDLGRIAFRMKEKEFFQSAIALLQERHDYNPTLWSYGLLHNVIPTAREFLLHADQIVAECGGPIVSPLLTVDPVARYQYEHLEYKPLVNARAHSLGQRRQIVNERFHEQYDRFLKLLSYRKQLTDDDQLAVAYDLLLQDRIDEAMAAFAHVNPEKVATRIQYDYCSAYLAMYSDDPAKARAIATRYANYPVDRWRGSFASLSQQLDEIDGKGAQMVDADDRAQRQALLAAREPGVEFTVDAKTINMTWQNVESARVNYYLMDVELLFSRNPFVQQSGGQFASIRPNLTQDVKLPADKSKLAIQLPDDLIRRNVLVEISAGGKTRAQPYYANAMDVKLNENYGQLRVTDTATGKALAKVYVKTYVRLADGTVKFYKDGYTDLRGRFDYATVSTPEHTPLTRFSILVLSDEHGAMIREAAPPQQ